MKHTRARGLSGRRRTLADVRCANCGRDFHPLYASQRNCSVECGRRARTNPWETKRQRVVSDTEAVRRAYEAGASTAELAEQIGCSVSAITRSLLRSGTIIRPPWVERTKRLSDGRGAASPRWKGGRLKTPQGYILVFAPEHPSATKKGYMMEHRLVWELANGPIPPGHHIHHVNHDKADNRLENLRMLTKAEHHHEHAANDPDWHQFTKTELSDAGKRGAAARWGKS